jgi:hypothetical protein
VHPWAFHWLHEIFIPKKVHHHLEPEWEMRRTGWENQSEKCEGPGGINRVHYAPGSH